MQLKIEMITWKQVPVCQQTLFGSDICTSIALDIPGMSKDQKGLHTSKVECDLQTRDL